jgi:threonyl-tRNA synthetase
MSLLQITFPDGSAREFEPKTTGFDVAKSIAPGLAKKAIAVKLDGAVKDLHAPIDSNANIEILTFDQPEGREVFWHSSSHIMAQAVQELFPGTKLAIGPPIAEGWYYDFDVERPFLPEDLEKIEKRMTEIIKENSKFRCEVMSSKDAIDHYRKLGADYKVELIEDLGEENVSFYYHSSFEDLCLGPHIPSTGIVKAFKLISTSGAYWRGDEKRTMLQRIYGISFPKKVLLEEHLERLEEARKRDHRLLGKELDLFSISEEVGAGLVLWHPKGARLRNEIENFWREQHLAKGYELVYSPHIAHRELWDKSGHTDFYDDSMFGPIAVDEKLFQLKPMNCPFHIIMYRNRRWSYRDLPLRWAELGTVYRYERPGVLHGLMRVRGFTQDDAHHFVTQEGMEDELAWILKFCIDLLNAFGFSKYDILLSTQPEKAIGETEDWRRAEAGLASALKQVGLEYEIADGDGAFYGPKIDINIKDALNRSWQCSTIQFDFSLPERFDLTYIASDGSRKRPFMIHRALLGSIERFIGILIEHYAGNFPLWLAPTQIKVLPISDAFIEYGAELVNRLKEEGFRVSLDHRSEKIGAKIRDAELQKVPYMLIIGAKEAEAKTVSIRKHGAGDQGSKLLDDVIGMLKAELESKGN